MTGYRGQRVVTTFCTERIVKTECGLKYTTNLERRRDGSFSVGVESRRPRRDQRIDPRSGTTNWLCNVRMGSIPEADALPSVCSASMSASTSPAR
jgi:hypothetical protein